MEFSRREYWSGLSFLLQGDLPDPEPETVTSASPTLAGGFLPLEPPGEPPPHTHTRMHDQWYLPGAYRGQSHLCYTLGPWITVLFAA